MKILAITAAAALASIATFAGANSAKACSWCVVTPQNSGLNPTFIRRSPAGTSTIIRGGQQPTFVRPSYGGATIIGPNSGSLRW